MKLHTLFRWLTIVTLTATAVRASIAEQPNVIVTENETRFTIDALLVMLETLFKFRGNTLLPKTTSTFAVKLEPMVR